jgi:hypothetical protein
MQPQRHARMLPTRVTIVNLTIALGYHVNSPQQNMWLRVRVTLGEGSGHLLLWQQVEGVHLQKGSSDPNTEGKENHV